MEFEKQNCLQNKEKSRHRVYRFCDIEEAFKVILAPVEVGVRMTIWADFAFPDAFAQGIWGSKMIH